MQPPQRPAFSIPPTLIPQILHNLRHTSVAALAAVTLSLSPCIPTRPTRNPRTHNTRIYNFSRRPRHMYASANPVVVFDKDYAARRMPIWQFDTEPPQEQTTEQKHAVEQPAPRTQPQSPIDRALQRPPPLPPGPLLSSEVRILTRLLVALVVGGVIGMERRAANSLAGVRTFSLVSLGAAIFMSTTLVAFPNSDPARVAAAISSSVGFLGAGAMHKSAKQSRGLTTASSVWLAAALGIAAASGMFLLSFTGAISTVLIARYARFDSSLHLIRGDPLGDEEDEEDDDDDMHDDDFVEEDMALSDGELRFRDRGMAMKDARRNGLFVNERYEGEMYEYQIVDIDPSSQNGASGGRDGEFRERNGNGNGVEREGER